MNDTIRTQLAHSSVRAFTDEPVTSEMRTQILDAARAASSSCALQVTSIIRVTDPALRARIAELSGGQAHVTAAPEFWVFCADYHRLLVLCPEAGLGWTEQFLVGCLDTGIMAQNAFTALESLGLGGCFIGGIRNGIAEVSALLRLPQNVFPVVGIAFGHPAVRNPVKPRLPAAVTFMENGYEEPASTELDAYDETMRAYYAGRGSNAREATFRDSIRPVIARERRRFLLEYLQAQGFAFR